MKACLALAVLALLAVSFYAAEADAIVGGRRDLQNIKFDLGNYKGKVYDHLKKYQDTHNKKYVNVKYDFNNHNKKHDYNNYKKVIVKKEKKCYDECYCYVDSDGHYYHESDYHHGCEEKVCDCHDYSDFYFKKVYKCDN